MRNQVMARRFAAQEKAQVEAEAREQWVAERALVYLADDGIEALHSSVLAGIADLLSTPCTIDAGAAISAIMTAAAFDSSEHALRACHIIRQIGATALAEIDAEKQDRLEPEQREAP